MKYCQYCGTQLFDDAKFCSHCGKETSQSPQKAATNDESVKLHNTQAEIVYTLSSRLKANGIIWLVIASLQIIIGIAGVWFTLIVGVLNIISAISDIKSSKRIRFDQNDIFKTYQPLTGPIITLIYNVVIGGIIGVLGSIYYLVFVRGFVIKNKDQFLALEANKTLDNQLSKEAKQEVDIEVILTEQEALHGVQKDLQLSGLQQPLRVSFPKRTANDSIFALHNINIENQDGERIKKDICVRVHVQK